MCCPSTSGQQSGGNTRNRCLLREVGALGYVCKVRQRPPQVSCGCGSGIECCSTVKASEKRCHLGRVCLLVVTRREVMPGYTEVWASQGCEAWHTFNKHDLIWYIYNIYVIPENTALTVFYAYFKLEVLKCLPLPFLFCFAVDIRQGNFYQHILIILKYFLPSQRD